MLNLWSWYHGTNLRLPLCAILNDNSDLLFLQFIKVICMSRGTRPQTLQAFVGRPIALEFVPLEFGMCPGVFSASVSPSCVFSPLLSHSCLRPALSAHCGGGGGPTAALPVGALPCMCSCPRQRGGECGWVNRWLGPRRSLPGCRLLP